MPEHPADNWVKTCIEGTYGPYYWHNESYQWNVVFNPYVGRWAVSPYREATA